LIVKAGGTYKVKLHKTLILPILYMSVKVWSLSKREKRGLRAFDKKRDEKYFKSKKLMMSEEKG
jgi:hypothetical protein